MGKALKFCLPIIGALVAAPAALAQQKPDMVQTMELFLQANHAATKCAKPDQATLSRFLANFKEVTLRAAEEMKKRNPGMSEQQVYEGFRTSNNTVARQVDGMIQAGGCGDPRIQDLLKRFETQANLKL
ncbi:MAG TPA: hypothetical protein VFF03_05835 [Rhodocyclaceae bacterium]|nr:hypothetical protein [Rhodocyclaceae bacterium]